MGTKIDNLPELQRRLALEADIRGNADGVVTADELRELAAGLNSELVEKIGLGEARREAIQQLLGTVADVRLETLTPAVRKLPPPLRRLALQVDALWGNADGDISLAELERVAEFYLKATPYFARDASALLDLADFLGYGDAPSGSLLQLRRAEGRARADPEAAEVGRLFREVLAEAGVEGLPELVTCRRQHSVKYHQWGVLEHTAAAVSAIRDLARAIDFEWKPAGAVMLLHDIGKILDRMVETTDDPADPGVWFAGHATIGARWLEAHGVDPALVDHILYHEAIRKHSVAETIARCNHDPRRVAESILVFLADQIAKGTRSEQLASFDASLPKLRSLASFAGVDLQLLLETRQNLLRFGDE